VTHRQPKLRPMQLMAESDKLKDFTAEQLQLIYRRDDYQKLLQLVAFIVGLSNEQFCSSSQAFSHSQSLLYHHSSSSLTFNVTRTQYIKDQTLITARRQCWMVFSCETLTLISIMGIILEEPSLFMSTFTHSRSTTFSLSPYSLFPQSIIPCMLIPSYCHLYVQHTRIILVVHYFTSIIHAHNSQTVH